MNKGLTQYIISGILIAAGFAGVFGLSNYLEKNRISLPEAYEDEDLALQGKRLKGFVLGAEGLMADWYWMQSLQYIGNKLIKDQADVVDLGDLRRLNPRLLYPYLDNATDLDPHIMAAYTFGATMLPAIDMDQAIALTEKGIANNPDSWRLHHLLGYIYWTNNDFEKAAQAYDNGVKIDGSPQFMKIMAAAMRTQGGSRETARKMYEEMLQANPDEQTRSNAEFRLMELDSLDERDALEKVIADYRTKNGSCPQSLKQILPLLRAIKLPAGRNFKLDGDDNLVDPSGAPYLLDRENCVVRLDAERTKLPL